MRSMKPLIFDTRRILSKCAERGSSNSTTGKPVDLSAAVYAFTPVAVVEDLPELPLSLNPGGCEMHIGSILSSISKMQAINNKRVTDISDTVGGQRNECAGWFSV
jgi:hypothetical protein